MGILSSYDLTEQASIYGSYHHHPMNRLIHFICVPMILFAIILWLSYPLQYSIPTQYTQAFSPANFDHRVTVAMVFAVLVSLFYATLDALAGLLVFAELMSMCFGANVGLSQYGFYQCFWFGVVLQIVGWGVQVGVGHGYYEGRSPAVTESLFQSLISPLFLGLEALFFFGYRPSMYQEIEQRSLVKIAEWKKRTAKKAC